MKPQTATIASVSILLVLAALCVGGRQYVDARQESAHHSAPHTVAPLAPHHQSESPIAGRPGKSLAASNPDLFKKQLRNALLTQDEAQRTRALLDLFTRFTEEDWEPALAAVQAMGIGRGYSGWVFILSAWAEVAPARALEWAIQAKAGSGAALQTWIARDPDAAMSYLASRQGADWDTSAALHAGAINALENDLPRLGRLLGGIQDQKIRESAVYRARLEFKNYSPETLKAWLTTLDPVAKPCGFQIVMKALPGFEEKAAFVRDFPDLTEPYHHTQIYGAWAKVDPEAASAALEKMEPGTLQTHAMMGVAHALSGKGDAAGAFALTHRYPREIKNVFLSDLINETMDTHPELAIAEIPRLEYEFSKVGQYGHVLARWLRKDRAAAKEWLEENEIPYQVRKELQEQGLLEK